MTPSNYSLGRKRLSRNRLFHLQQLHSPWLLGLTVVTIAILILLGGAPNVPGWRVSVMTVFSAALLSFAIRSGSWAEFSKLGRLQKAFLFSFIFLPLIQVLPLPPAVWQLFPGREVEHQIFALVGADKQWHSISLNPVETLFAWTLIIPGAALFLAILKLNVDERHLVVLSVVALALTSVVIGLLQFSSNGGIFNFYDSSHKRFLLGFFANRNHQGLFIASALAFSISIIFKISNNRSLALALCGIASFFAVGAVVATASRSGLSLTILAAVLTVLANTWNGNKRWQVVMTLAIISILFVMAFQSIGNVFENVLDRYSAADGDQRWEIWAQSSNIISNYFPWGSGMGTFVPIYKKFEPLEMVAQTYVNHAHNDYLELVIETGVFGIAVIILFIASFLQALIRTPASQFTGIKAASFIIILLVLVHSIVDYPLRTQAMAAIFAFCLAVIFQPAKTVN